MTAGQSDSKDSQDESVNYGFLNGALVVSLMCSAYKGYQFGKALNNPPIPRSTPASPPMDPFWGMILGFSLLGAVVVGWVVILIKGVKLAPALYRFVRGGGGYAKQWYQLQFTALLLTLGFGLVGQIVTSSVLQKPLTESLVYVALPTVVAGLAFYIMMMGLMPACFFDEYIMGKKAKEFLSCIDSKAVPLRCVGGSVVLLILSVFILSIPLTVFRPS